MYLKHKIQTMLTSKKNENVNTSSGEIVTSNSNIIATNQSTSPVSIKIASRNTKAKNNSRYYSPTSNGGLLITTLSSSKNIKRQVQTENNLSIEDVKKQFDFAENKIQSMIKQINKEINKKKEMRTVPLAEFITSWNEMEKYWINNDGDMDENSYYNRIINQDINIELPLLGIKTKLFWCPPTVECLDDMFDRMVEETYLELLVEKEDCFSTGGGIWLAEVPFEYGDRQLVMVVNNEDSKEWAVYQNALKDNGKYESVEYEELMEFTGSANNILPDFQIYYIRALQLLADR